MQIIRHIAFWGCVALFFVSICINNLMKNGGNYVKIINWEYFGINFDKQL